MAATKTKVPRGTVRRRRPDPEGEAWQAEAGRRWEAARHDPAEYVAPALPAFAGAAHVSREVLGRYLHDRDRNVVHDVLHAFESCAVDVIRNATFVHFAHELEASLPAGVADCACMTEEG